MKEDAQIKPVRRWPLASHRGRLAPQSRPLIGTPCNNTRDGLKLRHIKISHTSFFFMKHKIMLALEDLQEISPAMIEDVVEAGKIYVPESEKWTKFGPGAKRKLRKRGTRSAKRGLSDKQICIF